MYKSLSEQETSRPGVLTPAGRTPRQMKAQGPHLLTQPSSGVGGGQRSRFLLSVLQQSAATSKAGGSAQLPAPRAHVEAGCAKLFRPQKYSLPAPDGR